MIPELVITISRISPRPGKSSNCGNESFRRITAMVVVPSGVVATG